MNSIVQSALHKKNPVAIKLGYSPDHLTVNAVESAFYFNDEIITDLLDNDLYKFNMAFGVQELFPNTQVVVEFKCRTDENLEPIYDEVVRQIHSLHGKGFSECQIATLRNKASYCAEQFFRFLKGYTLDTRGFTITKEGKNNLSIQCKGTYIDQIFFEILVLAIVSELRNVYLYPNATMTQFNSRLQKKIEKLKQYQSEGLIDDGFKFADFGTRRRFSKKVQDHLVSELKKAFPKNFVGTSNVRLAGEHQLTAIGTQAHEWFMFHQQLDYKIRLSQQMALENWIKLFRGRNGIALTDCINMTSFTNDFDPYFAKLFDGLRHDSGCPFKWAEMAIHAFEKNGVDPKHKTLVFSDSLDFELAVKIYNTFKGRVGMSFGIGTFLTSDMEIEGFKALSIVMKLTEVNGEPVVKLSDSEGKTMCKDELYVQYVESVFDHKNRIKI